MIEIKIPSNKGHDVKTLPLLDARELLSEYTQKQWLMSINGKVSSVDKLNDGDKVSVYPKIAGG